MSFADPQSVTVSGTPISMPLTSREGDETTYTSSDGLNKYSVSHTVTKQGRARRVVRFDVRKVTADPYKPAENVDVTASCYVVFDIPKAGYTPTEMKAAWDGFAANLAASSGANILKLLQGES